MCGRYTYYSSSDIIKEYNLESSEDLQLALQFPDNYNVSPTNQMPVIIRGKQEHIVEFMQWGLIPSWSKLPGTSLKLINARQEGLLEKPMWKSLVKSKRCIVPARGFYEWKTIEGIKYPHYITLKHGEVMSFAGLYDEWRDANGNLLMTYTIITTTPNKEMSEIHNRMPAIFNKKQMDTWLEPIVFNRDQLDELLAPLKDGRLDIVRVSKNVNNARNNSEDLIYKLDS